MHGVVNRHQSAALRRKGDGCHGAGLCDETTDLDGRHLVPEAVNWPQDAARFLRDVL